MNIFLFGQGSNFFMILFLRMLSRHLVKVIK